MLLTVRQTAGRRNLARWLISSGLPELVKNDDDDDDQLSEVGQVEKNCCE